MIALFLACSQPEPPRLLDTGWFDTDGADSGDGRCASHVVGTVPGAGEQGWYHRDPLVVQTGTRDMARYPTTLEDDLGRPVPVQIAWDPEVLAYTVTPTAPLAPATDHVLRIRDCEQDLAVPFRTSDYGLPLTDPPESLRDRTFHVDLPGGTWRQPGGVGPLLSLYFHDPVLLTVREASPTLLQLALNVGRTTGDGVPVQDASEPVIPFPPTAFHPSPFFRAEVDLVPLTVSGVSLPVHGFAFSGTFSSHGTRIGGGTVQGIADTRHAGALLGSDRAEAVCDFGAGLGVSCTPCPDDGEPLCLAIEVVGIEGELVPGLVLTP